MPVSTRVPPRRRIVPIDGSVQVGKAISARPWGELALLANYIRGRGAMLVPGHVPNVSVIFGGSPSTFTFRYRTRPTGLAVTRLWEVEVVSVGSSVGVADIVINGGPAMGVAPPATMQYPARTYEYLETVAKTALVTDLTVAVTATAGTVRVTKVTCWELPRAQLAKSALELGVDLGSIDPDRPIIERDYESVNGVCRALAASDGRRVGLASWAGRVRVSASTFTPIFELPIRVVPPKVGNVTTRVCTWDVYAYATAGTTGEARIVDAASGSSAVLGIGTTTPAWRGPGTKSLLCEDLVMPDGLPGGSFETVQLEIRSTVAGIFVHVEAFSLWDDLW